MSALSSPLRKQLENAIKAARTAAEAGARKALEALAVHEADPYRHMDDAQRTLRRRLRAQARQLGDAESRTRPGTYDIHHLAEKVAYDQWHRLLFARFLIENGLLISPEHEVSVTLADCEELAPTLGLRDAWAVAGHFTAAVLPEAFRADDPAAAVDLPIEERNQLLRLLTSLPADTFKASDSLGWTYQFWQAERKDAVNASGVKIGADELSPVTQLFTEDYMVDFLLDNTLGAWHAGKVLASHPNLADSAQCEDELRQAVALPGCPWKYLRFVKVARPSRSGSEEEVARPSRSGPEIPPDRDGLATTLGPDRDGLATTLGPDRDGLATTPAGPATTITSGEYLPHWTRDHAIYHVAFRLADSVPQSKREEWILEREGIAAIARREERDLTPEEQERMRFLYSERIEKFLDAGHGECLLRLPEIADTVAGALRHFEGQRYALHAWCVMPNHVHVIVEPLPGHDLSKIIHSWKSFTAHEINKRLGRSGDVWQHDAYNHIIRSINEYAFQIAYVWENPDKAHLPLWTWRWKVASPSLVARPSRSGPQEEVARPSRSGAGIPPDRDGLATTLVPDRDGLATFPDGRPTPAATRWTPAAGTFDGWPKSAAAIRALDPCMGSGHFIVALFDRLVALRMAEESLSEPDAVAAVIRDNLFGLEIDPRCTQIAAFNLALAARRRVGHCKLPDMNLACSGLAPNTREADWLAIAGDNQKLQRGMERLYRLFQKAAVLGSLINPRAGEGDLLEAAFHELQPLLEKALSHETKDDTAHEMAVTARGLAKAAEILAGQFTLVATNVPYLGAKKQDDALQDYCARAHPDAKSDLATCVVERCLDFCADGCSTTLVTPQNWLFLSTYKNLRQRLLEEVQWDLVIRLGEHAFDSAQAAGAFAALLGLSKKRAANNSNLAAIDAAAEKTPELKADVLRKSIPVHVAQAGQLGNPDSRITSELCGNVPLLEVLATNHQGLSTGDNPRFRRSFWEVATFGSKWEAEQSTVESAEPYGGRSGILLWEGGRGELYRFGRENVESLHNVDRRGEEAWGHLGVAVAQMRELPATLYGGQKFDTNAAVLIPKHRKHLLAIWTFCSSPEFHACVRRIDQKVNVTNATLVKVPFDLAHWQRVAAEKYPNGLPKPYSSDPTQWLFDGKVARASRPAEVARASRSGPEGVVARASRSGLETPDRDGLATPDPDRDGLATLAPDRDGLATHGQAAHVAVARLLGYRWPRQTGSSFPDCPALGPDGLEAFADEDGIVCLSATKGEPPAAERLRSLLSHALGPFDVQQLLASTGPKGSKSVTLEEWLRDEFFEQHCAIFHHRPFIWHVWDGLKNGFGVLVNYHKLTHANLEKLTFAYLGDWIRRQQAAVEAGESGSDAKLQAAKELQATLKLILEGEPPFDLFVRWKPLSHQAIGWHPDLNDGVRMNIRPFLLAPDVGKKGAGILRAKPNIKWDKDRGKEPQRDKAEYPWFWGWDEERQDFAGGREFTGDRWNACHYTNEFKRRARKAKGYG